MKELMVVLIGSLQFGVIVYVLYLIYYGIKYLFRKKPIKTRIAKDIYKESRKKAIISASILVILLTIKYFTR